MHAQSGNVIVVDIEVTQLKNKALQLSKVDVWSA
jgi:protocatechuate 3,4-dioxygenase beta subunit